MTKNDPNQQQGFTLIELLAALTIFFIVSAVLFGALINSLNAYHYTSGHNRLRQEANLVLRQLTEIHRTSPPGYELSMPDEHTITIHTTPEQHISNQAFTYTLAVNNTLVPSDGSTNIKATTGYNIKLTVTAEKQSFTLSTYIQRLAEEG